MELNHQRLLVGLCYRCPTSTVNDDKISYLMEKAVLQIRSDHVRILGDFNFSEINYTEKTVSASVTDP